MVKSAETLNYLKCDTINTRILVFKPHALVTSATGTSILRILLDLVVR